MFKFRYGTCWLTNLPVFSLVYLVSGITGDVSLKSVIAVLRIKWRCEVFFSVEDEIEGARSESLRKLSLPFGRKK